MNYYLENIEKLRIHELRDFARKLGVGRPTTLKKEDLINSIRQVADQKGYNKLDNDSLHEGLDFFALLNEENSSILDDLIANSDQETKKHSTMLIKKNNSNNAGIVGINTLEPFTFSIGQNPAQYSCDNNSVCLSGYVDIHPNGYGILRVDGYVPNNNDAYFTTAFVKKYNLKKGMYITGNAKLVIEGKPRIIYELIQVHDKSSYKNVELFDDAKSNGLGEELYLDKHSLAIKLGERHYVEKANIKEVIDLCYDIVEENGVYVKLINLKAKPEDNYQSDSKLEIINIPFNKTELEVLNTVDLIFERAKREFELKKSNIIVIYNFCELIRYINLAYEGSYERSKINSKTINKIHNLLFTTKYVNADSSCTIICLDRDGVVDDVKVIMEYEFLPLFNKVNNSVLHK